MKYFLLIASLLIFASHLRGQTSPDSLLWKWLMEDFMSDPYKRLDIGRLDAIQKAMNKIRRTDTISDALAVGYYLLANDFILKRDARAADTCLVNGIKVASTPGVIAALYQMDEQLASTLMHDSARSLSSGEQAVHYYDIAGERVEVLATYANMIFSALQFNLCSRGMQQLKYARNYYTSIRTKLLPLEVSYYEKKLAPHQQFLEARCLVCLGDSLRIWENKAQSQKYYAKGKEILDAIDKKKLTPWEKGTVYFNIATTQHGTDAPTQEVLTSLDSAKIAFTGGKYDSLLPSLSGYRAYVSVLSGINADTAQLLTALSHLLGEKISTLFTPVKRNSLMQSKDLNNLYHIFLYKAEVVALLGRNEKTAYLRQAYQDYRTIMDIAEIQRLVITEDEALLSISHRYAHVMRRSIKILFQLYQQTANATLKKQYQEQMWEIVQKSKEYTLRQAIRKNDLTVYLPEIQAVAQEDSLHLVKLREAYQKYRLASGERPPSLFDEYNKEKKHYHEWIHSLPQRGDTYKRYYQERYQDDYINIERTIKMLKPNQTLIEYFFIDRYQLLVFIYNKKFSHVKQLALDDTFYADLRQLEAALTTPESNFYVQAKNLYDILIKPITSLLHEGTNRLMICPDKILADLPFEVLVDSIPENTEDYTLYPYLIKKYAIGYDYSAFTHYNCNKYIERTYPFDLVSFAPFWEALREDQIKPFRDDEKKLASKTLSLSKKEVEIIGRARALQQRMLLGSDANLYEFYQYAPLARILHISSHAIFDEKQLGTSFILFFPKGTESPSLSLKDVYNMKITAEMVVLSACETLKGRWREGEGMFSWGKVFSHSGALSVLASRWNAHEETSVGIVEVFYKNLPNYGKDIALQTAKSMYKNKHPHYWANFSIIGNQNFIRRP